MKPAAKLLIPLFIVLLILLVPVPLLIGALLLLFNSLYLPAVYTFLEEYLFIIVAAVLAILLVYAIARDRFGTHRALYSMFGIVLIALTFFLGRMPQTLYRQILALAVIASMEGAYFMMVHDRVARGWYLPLCAPAVLVLLPFPLYYLPFAGYAIFVTSFFVRPVSRSLSIAEVNLKSMGARAAGTAGTGTTRTASRSARTRPPARTDVPAKTGTAPKPAAPPAPTKTAKPPAPPKGRRMLAEDMLPANVVWPNQSDYSRAMQNMGFSISASYPEMRASKVMPNPFVKLPGNVVYSSGNYGTIFKLQSNGSVHALKCFTRRKSDLNKRYYAISGMLNAHAGSGLAFVDFEYMPKAIRTFKDPSTFFPALQMDWVEGRTLNTFISQHLSKSDALNAMAGTFLREMLKIREAGIAHGDISGDNIVIGDAGTLTLVDYDGMYIPEFAGDRAQELGHDHFQHPGRTAATYSERLDNFSILITYTSLLAVSENPSLWNKYNKGDQDCLIFRRGDFNSPSSSDVMKDLRKIRGKVRQLADLMDDALKHDPLWSGCDPQQIAKI